jgi:hypothetical protein
MGSASSSIPNALKVLRGTVLTLIFVKMSDRA